MNGIRFLDGLADIAPSDWDTLVPDGNPFVSHAFLAGLEATGCLRDDYGWRARHLALFDEGRLLAAAPTYLKGNSHGEFVFDWNWASAWERAGGDYYPKLLVASPYSPVPGPRLLVHPQADGAALRRRLTEALVEETDRLGLSSVHINFLAEADLDAFDPRWLARIDHQFHWHNRGYATFDDFLGTLNAKKRWNIRQERTHALAAGLALEMRGGDTLSATEWRQVHDLYRLTFDAHGNHPALTLKFFRHLGATMGDAVQVAMARDGDRIVAMALALRGGDTLYGRYWGASVDVSGLHFELCYYRGIEYAIAQGLARFEPGAQGEHKLARGFLPTATHSRHYIAHEGFRRAVAEALVQETEHREAYRDELMTRSPYAKR